MSSSSIITYISISTETSKVDRISEILEAEISGKVYEIRLCEECCLGGCGIDNPESLEEISNPGASLLPSEEFSRPDRGSGKYPGGHEVGLGQGEAEFVNKNAAGCGKSLMESQVGVKSGGLEENSSESRWDFGDAKSVSPEIEIQGSLEDSHLMPESSFGKVESCESSRLRSEGRGKDVGKPGSVRKGSECSWDATLKSFLLLKGIGNAGNETVNQVGKGLCVPCLGEEGQGYEDALGKCDESAPHFQVEDAAEDFIPQEEDFIRRRDSVEGASKRVFSQKSSLARNTDGRLQKSFSRKEGKRKENKKGG